MGFLHPERDGLVAQTGAALDARGNIDAPAYATSVEGVFAAGDARRGQSLIVWAINEGRQCALAVEAFLAAPRLRFLVLAPQPWGFRGVGKGEHIQRRSRRLRDDL